MSNVINFNGKKKKKREREANGYHGCRPKNLP